MFTRNNVIFAVLVACALAGAAAVLGLGGAGAATGIITLVSAGVVLVAAVVGRFAHRWFEPLLAALLVAGAGVLAAGVATGESVIAAVGVLGVIVVGAAGGMALVLADALGSRGRSTGGLPEQRAARVEQMIDKIHEYSMLSDTAKRVLFRERELELLRRVIEDDIERGDYNAALRLCDDMAEVFGFREEAEAYRSRLAETRHDHHETQVSAAMRELDACLAQRNWAAAHELAARIRRLFPESHAVDLATTRIARAREEQKQELEQAFIEAAEKEDVELAMQRLRELDRYLDKGEAGRLSEYAEAVVAKHRENLSVQFKIAVNDHRWADAARVGDAIMAEFPNTKMAEEVRSMIDVLRTRATQAAVAAGE